MAETSDGNCFPSSCSISLQLPSPVEFLLWIHAGLYPRRSPEAGIDPWINPVFAGSCKFFCRIWIPTDLQDKTFHWWLPLHPEIFHFRSSALSASGKGGCGTFGQRDQTAHWSGMISSPPWQGGSSIHPNSQCSPHPRKGLWLKAELSVSAHRAHPLPSTPNLPGGAGISKNSLCRNTNSPAVFPLFHGLLQCHQFPWRQFQVKSGGKGRNGRKTPGDEKSWAGKAGGPNAFKNGHLWTFPYIYGNLSQPCWGVWILPDKISVWRDFWDDPLVLSDHPSQLPSWNSLAAKRVGYRVKLIN